MLCYAVQRLYWDLGEQEYLELLDEQRHSEAVARLRQLVAFEHQPPPGATATAVSCGLLALPPPLSLPPTSSSSSSSASAAHSNGARASSPAAAASSSSCPSASASGAGDRGSTAAAGASASACACDGEGGTSASQAALVSASRATSPALNASVRHACTLHLARHAARAFSRGVRLLRLMRCVDDARAYSRSAVFEYPPTFWTLLSTVLRFR